MFKILIDTCVWLDLAKDPKQAAVVGVVDEMVGQKLVELIVPRIVLDEFRPNRDRIAIDGAHAGRMPETTREDPRSYFKSINAARRDLAQEASNALREQLTVFFRVLWHTGADISELKKLEVRDIRFGDKLKLIRLRCTKPRTPERLVPYSPSFVSELGDYISGRRLDRSDLVFNMRTLSSTSGSGIPAVTQAHRRARAAIG